MVYHQPNVINIKDGIVTVLDTNKCDLWILCVTHWDVIAFPLPFLLEAPPAAEDGGPPDVTKLHTIAQPTDR